MDSSVPNQYNHDTSVQSEHHDNSALAWARLHNLQNIVLKLSNSDKCYTYVDVFNLHYAMKDDNNALLSACKNKMQNITAILKDTEKRYSAHEVLKLCTKLNQEHNNKKNSFGWSFALGFATCAVFAGSLFFYRKP